MRPIVNMPRTYRQHAQKIGKVIAEISSRTDTQTDILITILRNRSRGRINKRIEKLETVSIAEPLQNRQHAPLMLSTLGSKETREGG